MNSIISIKCLKHISVHIHAIILLILVFQSNTAAQVNPASLSVKVECVTPIDGNTYIAYFGYANNTGLRIQEGWTDGTYTVSNVSFVFSGGSNLRDIHQPNEDLPGGPYLHYDAAGAYGAPHYHMLFFEERVGGNQFWTNGSAQVTTDGGNVTWKVNYTVTSTIPGEGPWNVSKFKVASSGQQTCSFHLYFDVEWRDVNDNPIPVPLTNLEKENFVVNAMNNIHTSRTAESRYLEPGQVNSYKGNKFPQDFATPAVPADRLWSIYENPNLDEFGLWVSCANESYSVSIGGLPADYEIVSGVGDDFTICLPPLPHSDIFGSGDYAIHGFYPGFAHDNPLDPAPALFGVASDKWSLHRLIIKQSGCTCDPIADFTADTTWGIGELCVQFINLSENAEQFLWDFGDGTTSTERNPVHCYYNPPRKHYSVTLTAFCPCAPDTFDVKTAYHFIKVMRAVKANFNAHPIVAAPGNEVQFVNNSGGVAGHFLWDFGDSTSEQYRSDVRIAMDPVHVYADTGEYTVSLKAWGPGGEDTRVVSGLIYVDPDFLDLEVIDAGETASNEGWDNAIDHDIISTNARLAAVSTDAWAIFKFADDRVHKIHKIRIMTNNADSSVYFNHLLREFELQASMDGLDYSSACSGIISSKYGWEIFEFDTVEAQYVKLKLTPRSAHSPYVSLTEVQVFGTTSPETKSRFKAINKNADPVAQIPEEYGLAQNYPNPFNPETLIRFQLPEASDVLLNIYNIHGQLIVTLVNAGYAAGTHQIVWNGQDLSGNMVAGGLYIYKIRASNAGETVRMTKKMMFIK